MWPTVFTIPWVNLPIRGYGLMLMIGFLGGTWWAARRAARVKANPDLVINLGFAALIFGIIGARLFYVIHYWERSFKGRGLWAVIDISAGGMEFYGGFLGAFAAVLVYLLIKRVSFRLYFDILAPSLMFGMGMARIGCFLNGCCWGAPCPASLPWAVRFPYASPAAYRQWEDRIVTFPAELIVHERGPKPELIPRDWLTLTPEQRRAPTVAYRKAEEDLRKAKDAKADEETIRKLTATLDKRRRQWEVKGQPDRLLGQQERYFDVTSSGLESLAHAPGGRTHAVHPAQLYASLDGLLLAFLLDAVFYRRKRHGIVFGLLFLLYPLMRIVEEIIRIDNPHDTAGMTISQFISVLLFLMGLIWTIAIYRRPLRSPAAVPYVPPPMEDAPRGKRRK